VPGGRFRAAALLALLVSAWGCEPRSAPRTGAPVVDRAADAFLDDLEKRTFQWFWDLADPATGLVPDRAPTPSFSSIAAVGFGLTAYAIGALS